MPKKKQGKAGWEKNLRRIVERHIIPQVKATRKKDIRFEKPMMKILAYQLGLEEVVQQWIKELKPIINKTRRNAVKEALGKIYKIIDKIASPQVASVIKYKIGEMTKEEKEAKKIWDQNMPLPVSTSEDIEQTFRNFGYRLEDLEEEGLK